MTDAPPPYPGIDPNLNPFQPPGGFRMDTTQEPYGMPQGHPMSASGSMFNFNTNSYGHAIILSSLPFCMFIYGHLLILQSSGGYCSLL